MSKVFPPGPAVPAIPPNPKIAAIIAITKNITAYRSIDKPPTSYFLAIDGILELSSPLVDLSLRFSLAFLLGQDPLPGLRIHQPQHRSLSYQTQTQFLTRQAAIGGVGVRMQIDEAAGRSRA